MIQNSGENNQEKINKLNYVYTLETECKGCNKCILKCPTRANSAHWENSRNIVHIKNGYCISCGECLSICDHGARDFFDDVDNFFQDLDDGLNISMLIAPAARLNFELFPNLVGYLKSRGVNKVFDVSYGADICTWAYVKYIKEHNPKTLIAQPCPVVVSYIEKFHNDLIDYISPVQSPLMCLGIYLKKYANLTDTLAFLSPCIGKKRECTDESTFATVKYNITFTKLIDYIEHNNINLSNYAPTAFDITDTSIGFAFPRPGGLTENVKLLVGDDVWTKQVEGIFNIEHYFKQFISDLEQDLPVPLIIDALNCEHGCNLGTGTKKSAKYNFIDNSINKRKRAVTKEQSDKLLNYFDNTLKLDDFYRKYTDRSAEYSVPEEVDLEPIYLALGKMSEEDRNLNCFSCGYGSCEDFVYAVAHGDNHINNCHHFLLEKFVSLSTTDVLTNAYNRYSYSEFLALLKDSHPKLVSILFADINKLKETNDLYGHDAGDKLIINVASLLRRFFGNNIYRVGGDEFIIIETYSTKELFDEKVASLKNALNTTDASILLSVGHAYSYSEDELDDRIAEAEQKMYLDKQEFYNKNAKYDRRR